MTAPDYAAMTNREHADELEFLRWFYRNAPCHGEHSNALKTFEALDALNERFKAETGKLPPPGYTYETEGGNNG